MKNIKIGNICKILFIIFCCIFLFTACSDERGGSIKNKNENQNELSQSQATCWQGEFLSVFYNTLGTQTSSVYKALTSEKILSLMMIAFSMWMAFQIMQHVGTSSPESIGEFWTKILRKATLCLICGTLASSSDQIIYVINTFIFPIYITILQFTSEILKIISSTADANIAGIEIKGDDGLELCEVYSNHLSSPGCTISNSGNINFSAEKFPDEPLKLMSCMACAVSDRLNVGYGIAMDLVEMPTMIATIVGGFIVVCFTIAKLGFVFYLVDSIFRLDMMLICLPFLILFYPFEQTRKWSIKGFQIILNSAAVMLCLAIIVSMSVLAMQKMLIDPSMNMNFASLEEYKNFGVVPMSIIFMGFLIVKASGMAVSLSSSITGGSGDTKFQKKFAALVGTVGKAVFLAFTAGAGKVATTVIEHSQRLRDINEKVQKIKKETAKVKNKMNKMAGRSNGSANEESDEGGEE